MAHGPLHKAFQHLRRLAGSAPGGDGTVVSDRQLLEAFVQQQDEAAFTELVERHGRMIQGLCQRLVHDPHGADDVFQATFLVLARKAASIHRYESVGSWLHGVACRLAKKQIGAAIRRRGHERQAAAMATTTSPPEATWQDLRPVLDEELNRLPEKYRAPLVLCYLEGKTSEQAAGLLGWPLGTLWGRLGRARDLLRDRLTRRGVTVGGAGIAALVAENASAAVQPVLAKTAIQAAMRVAAGQTTTGVLSPSAIILAEGLVTAMFFNRVKLAAALLLAVGLLGAGVGLAMQNKRADKQFVAVPPGAAPMWKQEKPVAALAFSPDALMLATASGDDTVILWDATTGQEKARLTRFKDQAKPTVQPKVYFEGPPSFPPTLAFSADGKTARGAWDLAAGWRVTHSWDVATGKELPLTTREARGDGWIPAAVSPDGKLLATVELRPAGLAVAGGPVAKGLLDSTIKLGTTVPEKELLKGGFRVILPRTVDDTLTAMRQETRQLQGHQGPVSALAFAPDGKYLASAGEDRTIRLWNVTTGKEVHRVDGLKAPAISLSFSARALASGSADGTVRIDDVAAALKK